MFFKKYYNSLSLLENYTYISDFDITTQEIPIAESKNSNCYLIEYSDLVNIKNMDTHTAIQYLAESHFLYEDQIKIVIDESDFIVDPYLFSNLNYIIRPLSIYDPINKVVDECVNSFLETGNDTFLDILLEDITEDEKFRRRRALAGITTGWSRKLFSI